MEECTGRSLKSLKDLLVYFEAYNRFLYRYNGLVIVEKVFLKSYNTKTLKHTFDVSCTLESVKTMKVLLKDKRLDSEFLYSSFLLCISRYLKKVVLVLLDDSRVVSKFPSNVYWCLSINCIDMVKLLVKHKKIDEAIRCAFDNDNTEIANLLVRNTRDGVNRILESDDERECLEMLDILRNAFLKKIKE